MQTVKLIEVAVANVRDALGMMLGIDGSSAPHAIHLIRFADRPELDLMLLIGTPTQLTRIAEWIDAHPEILA